MKRLVPVMATAAVLCFCFLVAIVIRDMQHRTWMDYTPGDINRLAVAIRAFREEQGVSPEKLSQLQTLPRLDDKEYMVKMLAGQTGNQYQYRAVSNGFVIAVSKPAGFLSKKEEMEKYFDW